MKNSSSENIRVFCSRPLSITVSISWIENFPFFSILSTTDCPRIIFFSYLRVSPSSRDAVLTVSPMTVASIRRFVPMVPTITSQAFIPIPTLIFFPILEIWNRLMKSCISIAQARALSDVSCSNIIIIPSPRNLSIYPPCL